MCGAHEHNQPIFLWWGHHYKQFVLRRWKILLFRSSMRTTLFCSFFSHYLWLNVNFSGWWLQRGGPIAWPLDLLIWRLWTFFFGTIRNIICTAKDWTHWMNSKQGSLQQLPNVTKATLQPVWQEVVYMWDVYRTTDGTHCEVFRT
jgi:hypothetical protein